MYPVRCAECMERSFAFFPVAWKYRRKKKKRS